MRKLFLRAVLVLIFCSADAASAYDPVPSEAVTGFGLYTVYMPNTAVTLSADAAPSYSGIRTLNANTYLAAKLKDDYSGIRPYGTLTDMVSGLQYTLAPDGNIDNFCTYSIPSALRGHKVMWNVFTSPDVRVGSAVIPETSALSREITQNDIVPYVRINRTRGSNNIGRVDVSFVRFGQHTPAAFGSGTVNVYINGYVYHNTVYGYSDSYSFTNFTNPIRDSFYVNMPKSELRNIIVEYEKNGAAYIWEFQDTDLYEDTSIDWEKLETDPFTLSADSSVDVEITFSSMPLSELLDDVDDIDSWWAEKLTTGSKSVLEVIPDSVWYEDGQPSRLGFTLHGLKPGRSSLKIAIPEAGTYYREIHVVSDDGDMHLDDDTHGLSLAVKGCTSRAQILNGRPWYPSAKMAHIDLVLASSEDVDLSEGNIFVSNDSTSYMIHTYISYPFTKDKIDNTSLWMEFPNREDLNVASASLKALISGDYMTTDEQLANFVPYFEMKRTLEAYDINIISVDWSFITPSTGETVTPDVSELRFYGWDDYYDGLELSGTSGTISLEYADYWDGDMELSFSYVYEGVRYVWEFVTMSDLKRADIPSVLMKAGTSQDITVTFSDSSDIEAIDLVFWEDDILSADVTHFEPADSISFTVTALKEGITNINFVYTLSGDEKYADNDNYSGVVMVTSSDITQEELTPSFYGSTLEASIVEGNSAAYSAENNHLTVYFYRDGYLPAAYIDELADISSGTLSFYSGDEELFSHDIYPQVYYGNYMDNFLKIRYVGSYYTDDERTPSSIVWTSSSDLFTSGSADIPTGKTQDYRPFIRLNRDGLNVSTIEYYFVDSQGSRIDTPETVSNVEVDLILSTYETYYYYDGYHYYDGDYYYDDPGVITLNVPESHIELISMYYEDNGIHYSAFFSNVSGVSDASYVMDWDISSPDMPLIMTVGDTLEVTLTNENISSPAAYIGNSSIVSMDFLRSADHSVSVRLTAKSAGMTSITLANPSAAGYGVKKTLPREIWVADSDGKVPHLTGNGSIDDIIELLMSGDTSGWWTDDNSGSTPGQDSTPDYATEDPIDAIDGLSVYPRFAMPANPAGAAYDSMWDDVYSSRDYNGVYTFEEYVNVLASRDAETVFYELSADLIALEPAQLLAVVLPEIEVETEGTYTLRLPVDNITIPGTAIFMHVFSQDNVSSALGEYITCYSDDGTELYGEVSGDEYINVSVYLEAGTYAPIITALATSDDIRILSSLPVSSDDEPVSPDVTSASDDEKPESPDITPESPDNPVPTPTPEPESGDTPSPTPTPTPSPTPGSNPGGSNSGGSSSGGSSSGGSTDERDITSIMIPAAPTRPNVDVQDTTLIQRITNAITALNSTLFGNYDVIELSDDAVITERSSLTDYELSQIPDTEIPAVVLPVMSVDKTAIYVFGVSITNLAYGTKIFLYMMPEYISSSSGFTASETDYDAYIFLDDEGNQTTKVPGNHHVNIAALMEPNVVYSPVITTTAQSSEGDSSNNSGGNNSGGNNSTDTNDAGGSGGGGGCTTGLTSAYLVLGVMALTLRKR